LGKQREENEKVGETLFGRFLEPQPKILLRHDLGIMNTISAAAYNASKASTSIFRGKTAV
jgi:hypothetical protein